VPIPADATVGNPQGAVSSGPDLRPQRINQRTGQPTTLGDPEGMDQIPDDPHLAAHTVEGAAAVSPVLIVRDRKFAAEP
jgi:hypothetical protein